jgi:hypothetical protein
MYILILGEYARKNSYLVFHRYLSHCLIQYTINKYATEYHVTHPRKNSYLVFLYVSSYDGLNSNITTHFLTCLASCLA